MASVESCAIGAIMLCFGEHFHEFCRINCNVLDVVFCDFFLLTPPLVCAALGADPGALKGSRPEYDEYSMREFREHVIQEVKY